MPAGFSAPAPLTITVALGAPCFSSALQADAVVLFFQPLFAGQLVSSRCLQREVNAVYAIFLFLGFS